MTTAWSEIKELLDSLVRKGGPPLIKKEAMDRRKQIVKWWQLSGGWVFVAFATPKEIVRVLAAFMRVLLAIPMKDFQRFMKFEPRFLCSPRSHGAVWRFHMKVPVKDIRIIYLAPDFDEWSDEMLIYTLVHEVAHIVLNHSPSEYISRRSEAERSADNVLRKWGFADPRLDSKEALGTLH